MGNPGVVAARPGAPRSPTRARWGRARHVALHRRRRRRAAPAPSPSASRRPPARSARTRPSTPPSASSVNRWNGAVEPRAAPAPARAPARRRRSTCSASPSRLRGAPRWPSSTLRSAAVAAGRRAGAGRGRSSTAAARGIAGCLARRSSPPASRVLVRRAPTRRAGRAACAGALGGFALCSYAALERDPGARRRLRARRRARPARARRTRERLLRRRARRARPPGLGHA